MNYPYDQSEDDLTWGQFFFSIGIIVAFISAFVALFTLPPAFILAKLLSKSWLKVWFGTVVSIIVAALAWTIGQEVEKSGSFR